MKKLALLAAMVGAFVANTATSASILWIFDETEMPESLR